MNDATVRVVTGDGVQMASMDARPQHQSAVETPSSDDVSAKKQHSAPEAAAAAAEPIHSEDGSTREEKTKARPGYFKRLWAEYGLDWKGFIILAKCGLPPTIVLAMCQKTSIASIYGTTDYLAAIAAVLGFAILPRAKYIQALIANVLSVCIGAALAALTLWTAVQARINTADPTSKDPYNSSQSAVCGVWLFFQIYVVHALRSRFPQFTITTIIWSIFILVSTLGGPSFTTADQSLAFVKRLLYCFLTGFGASTAVSLLIFPVTCRTVVFQELSGYLKALDGSIKAQGQYFRSLEKAHMLSRISTDHGGKDGMTEEAMNLKKAAATVSALHGTLQGDLTFAKREIAYGWIGPDDLTKLVRLLQAVMLPLIGLSSMVEIFQRVADFMENDASSGDRLSAEESKKRKAKTTADWNEIMRFTREPFQSILTDMSEGLSHVAIKLHFEKDPRAAKKGRHGGRSQDATDLESDTTTHPGQRGFAAHLDRQCERFYKGKEVTLSLWCQRKGIEFEPDSFEHPTTAATILSEADGDAKHGGTSERQRQLFFVLYIGFLLYTTCQAMVELVQFADELGEKSSNKRWILPGARRTMKWFRGAFEGDESANDAQNEGRHTVRLGQAYNARKDADHLPPQGAFEEIGNKLRKIPAMLRSSHSSFGLRVAAAVMCVSIVGLLHDTQVFFIKNRLIWAAIMVCISMTPTTGQTGFGFALRLFGTVVAVVLSFIVWYAPNQETPGILVLFWFFASLSHYVLIKMPQYMMVGLISIITMTMIIGYELETRVLGQAVIESNGQTYYETYILGPYRLATVAGGLAVALIWTIFPYPISEHSALRNEVASSLYLLANYYSIVHELNRARIRGDQGDESVKGSPAHRLFKHRTKVYAKQALLINSLKMHSCLLKWEMPIGGRFPKEKYDCIINCVENILNYMSLISYGSRSFSHANTNEHNATWMRDFRALISSVNLTSHEVTSMLCLLSAAMANGQPLPPYLVAPQPYRLAQRLQEKDKDILSVRHIAEDGYAAFAVVQVASRCIMDDLDKLLVTVKELVGELDFSFHVTSTTDGATAAAAGGLSTESFGDGNSDREKSD